MRDESGMPLVTWDSGAMFRALGMQAPQAKSGYEVHGDPNLYKARSANSAALTRRLSNAQSESGTPGLDSFVELVRANEVRCEPIHWLWPNWLAAGKLHILAGAAGTGKTTLALKLAATVSVGGKWPDGTHCQKGDVVMWSGEDDPSDVLVPRLRAMGADRNRVHFVGNVINKRDRRPFDPAKDIEHLRANMPVGTSLLIVDSIVSAVAADSHKNGEVRRSLQPLVDMATKLRCAVIGITHFTKGTAGREPLERVTGSLAFGALARVVLITAKRHDSEQRLLARAKSNIGPDAGGFNYALQQIEIAESASQSILASRVVWGEYLNGTARELLGAAEAHLADAASEASPEVEAFLLDLLSNGPVTAKQMKCDSHDAGYSWDRIKRAATRLRVRRRKISMQEGWVWELPVSRFCEVSAEEGEASTQTCLHSSHPSGGE